MTDLRELLELVPEDLRDQCALALEEGIARAEGRMLTGETPERAPEHARPRARGRIPVHPEVPPAWWLEERRALAQGRRDPRSRAERRALEAAQRIAEGRADELEREAYRARVRTHQRRYRRRWRYLRPQPAPDGLGESRPATAQQLLASRSALADEWGCRSAVAALPVEIARRLTDWITGLAPSDLYGSPWASRLARRTVATACAILYAARPSWRPGYALVTTGFSRERLAGIIGPAPESGRRYSVSSLAHTELGSLAILEDLGILERTQIPGDVAPASDRGASWAFNHYLVPVELLELHDEWGDPSRPNPGLPRELLERVTPWCTAPEGETARLEAVRAAALEAELVRLEGGPPPADEDLVDVPADELLELEDAEPPDRPPDRSGDDAR